MSIKNFFHEIEKGLSSPVYLLHSDDPYLLEEALSAVKRKIPEAEADFNFNVFDIDSPDAVPTPEQIIEALNTISFFGKKRYVIAKNFQKLSSKDFKRFHGYISNPSPDSAFIMLYNGNLKKELREETKAIKTICLDIRKQDMPFWIKERAKQKGIEITDEAVEYLIGIVGSDIGLLSSEVEKLALIGSKTINNIEHIREVVEGNKDYSVFDLTRALREKETEKVFRIYKVLSETIESYNLLGAVNWQYSQMYTQASGKDSAAQKDYFRRVFELLNDADIQIKTSGGSYPLEHLLVKLLQL